MIDPGQLDRFVSIEQRVLGQDAATGAQTVTWSTFAAGWAKVDEMAVSTRLRDERMSGDVAVYGKPVQVTMRWLAGVDATMRVNDNGVLYQVIGVARIGRYEGLSLACTAFTVD